jgi:hypothetical protein
MLPLVRADTALYFCPWTLNFVMARHSCSRHKGSKHR